MKKIRFGVFETNSSSSHTITIVSKEEFEAWKKGNLLFDTRIATLCTEKECEVDYEENKKHYEDFEEFKEDIYRTYKEWYDENDGLELFIEPHTTKGGEQIVAFGKYY